MAKRHPEYQGRFVTSLLINVVLVLLVAGMVVIAWNSDAPNIVNYRQAVVNEYSEWEQELTERERKVRNAERELQIESLKTE